MNKRIWLLVFGTALLLAGCSNLTAPTVTLEAGVTEATPTQITVTPSITNTFTPTPLPPTWTPLPTLAQDDKQRLVSDLLSTNGGCRLPCWWGIFPGQTKWTQAYQFLSQFDQNITLTDNSESLFTASAKIPTPKKVGYADLLFQDYDIRDGVVESINVYNYDLAPVLYLTNFLNTYGPPDEVWIRTQAIEEQGGQPFEIALFYPEQGILMSYSGGDLTTIGDNLRNCLGELTSPFIFLWNASDQVNFKQAEDWYLDAGDPDWTFISIEEAAGMDAKTFYELFKNPGNNACIVTPKNIWPGGQ